MKRFLVLLLVPLGAAAADIPVVGLDKNHQPRAMSISDAQYTRLYAALIGKVNAPTLATLESRDRTGSGTYWMLRDVVVGLGLNFSVGLGPIWSVSAAPRVRLGFSNSTHPKVPD